MFAAVMAANGAGAGSPWPVLLLLVPGLLWMIGFPLFVRRRSSRARPIPADRDYAALGFPVGRGVRFVGGVATRPGDVTKRASWPFGELIVDESHLVLRYRGFISTWGDSTLLPRENVVAVTRGWTGLGKAVCFQTPEDPTGRARFCGGRSVLSALGELGWPIEDEVNAAGTRRPLSGGT